MLIVHMLNYFEEITKPVYTGFELASKTKKYRKLVVNPDYGMSYEAGVFYCSSEFIAVIEYLYHVSKVTPIGLQLCSFHLM